MIIDIDLFKSLLWRHNEAENLQQLIQYKQDFLNVHNKKFWQDWINDVFNLNTANEFGLIVWSIILNIPLTINSQPSGAIAFGFGPFRKNYNSGQFEKNTENISLNIEQARLILKMRFYNLITRGTIPECSKIVKEVFASYGNAYCLDGLDMTITYVFDFSLPAFIRQIIRNYDLLPRPATVKANIIDNPNSYFGFGSFRKNFNNGNFRP